MSIGVIILVLHVISLVILVLMKETKIAFYVVRVLVLLMELV